MAQPPAAISRLGCAYRPAKLGVLTMANSHQDVEPKRADGDGDGDGQVGEWVAMPLEPVLVRVGAGVAEPVPRNWFFGTRLAGENRRAAVGVVKSGDRAALVG